MPTSLDVRSRVTVVGDRKRVDVAVPAATPIGEYVNDLAELCGQATYYPLPVSWSLARAGTTPLPLDASLGSSGVVDGDVLYLCDLARDPGAEPVVDDVDELVAQQVRAVRAAGLPPGPVVIGLGLLWMVAVGLLALRATAAPVAPAMLLSAVSLALIAGAWALRHRPAKVPAVLRLATCLPAVLCLAVAGALLAQALGGAPYRGCGAVVGANLALLLALAAVPDGVLIALEIPVAAAIPVAVLLLVVDATPDQAAAAVVIAALSLIGLAKFLAATISAWGDRADGTAAVDEVVGDMLVRSRRLLAAVLAGPAAAVSVALVVLAWSGHGYAIVLAAVAATALLVRSRQAAFAEEIALLGGAGLVGLFAVTAGLLDRFAGSAAAIGLVAVAGLGLLGLGVGLTATTRGEPDPGAGEPDAGALLPVVAASRPNRLRFVDAIGVLCHLACASLAVGVFGVLSQLVAIGRTIIG